MVAVARITIELPADSAATLAYLLELTEKHAQQLLDHYKNPQQSLGATEILRTCGVVARAIDAAFNRIGGEAAREGQPGMASDRTDTAGRES